MPMPPSPLNPGYPPEALAVRRGGEPEVSHAVLAHTYWTNQARTDIAAKGLGWADGYAEGLRIASSLGSCTSEVMERATELTDRPDPYLAADAAWAAHEDERPTATPDCVDELEATLTAEPAPESVPTPWGWAHEVAPVAELALQAENTAAMDALAVSAGADYLAYAAHLEAFAADAPSPNAARIAAQCMRNWPTLNDAVDRPPRARVSSPSPAPAPELAKRLSR